MIPKIIHQTWKDANVDHWIFQRSQQSVREHLREWEYRFWTDDDLDAFMKMEFGEFYHQWKSLDRHIKRVDTARYCLLHRYGGVYADLDFIFTQNIDVLLEENCDLCFYLSTQAIVKQWEFLGNALMFSQPKQQFWLDVMEYMFGLPRETAVLHHTGPRALGAYYSSLAVKPNARIFGPDIFDNERCQDGVGERRYGYHVRTATWQHESHPQRRSELGPIFNRLTEVSQCARGAVEEYYIDHFNVPKNGFFVECGAGNGLIQTNTAFLERELGWSGILIESHDLLFSELVKNRAHERVRCLHETLGAPEKEVLFDEIVYDGSAGSQYLGWSSIVAKEGKFTKSKTSKSMTSVLKENGAPPVIDFCVIDVEGASSEVVNNLDLDAFDIRVLAVEIKPAGPYCELVNRILSAGYSLRHIIPQGPDYIFVKPSAS